MLPEHTSLQPPPLRIGLPSRLGEMLVRQGLVTPEDVESALADQAAGSEWRIGRLLVRRGALDDRTLAQAIAHQFHVQMVDLRVEPPTRVALERLTRDAAVRLQALPLRIDADALVVAVADPPVRELRVAVERCTGLPVRLVLAAADELGAALEHWYPETLVFDDGAAAVTPEPPDPSSLLAPPPVDVRPLDEPAPDRVEAAPEPAAATLPEVADASDLQIVLWVLTEAVHRDASAIHLDHGDDGLRIRYRVDGALVPGPLLPRDSGTVVCERLLEAAQLEPTAAGLAEGVFETLVDDRSITCRMTALTTATGTHLVVRTGTTARAERLEDLAVDRACASAVRAILQEGQGVVVVASTVPAAATDVCRVLVDETGPERHVVVDVTRDGSAARPGAVALALESATDGDRVVATARALGADVLVLDVDDADIRRAAFGAAADLLLVLRVQGDDATGVAAALVDEVGAPVVANVLRIVVVAGTDPYRPTAEVHLVTDDEAGGLPHPS